MSAIRSTGWFEGQSRAWAKLFVCLAVAWGAPCSVQATAIDWTNGSANLAWGTAGNWSGGVVPTNSDDVVFANNGGATQSVSVNGTEATQKYLSFGTRTSGATGSSSTYTYVDGASPGTISVGKSGSGGDNGYITNRSAGGNVQTFNVTVTNVTGRDLDLVPVTGGLTFAGDGTNAAITIVGSRTLFVADDDGTHFGSAPILVSGAISGTGGKVGVNATGANVTFSGPNSYTGATTVNRTTASGALPQLLIDGANSTGAGSYTVGAASGGGGILGGIGTISGTGNLTVLASGILTPGDPSLSGGVGTLTLNSSGTLNISAIAGTGVGSLKYDLGFSAGSDLVNSTNVSGTLNIGSGLKFSDFQFTTGGSFAPGEYFLFSNAGALSGSLGALSDLSGPLGGYTGTLALDGNSVVLNVAAVPEPSTFVLTGLGLLGLALARRRASH